MTLDVCKIVCICFVQDHSFLIATKTVSNIEYDNEVTICLAICLNVFLTKKINVCDHDLYFSWNCCVSSLIADFFFSIIESFNLEGTVPHSKGWPGFNQFAAILISQRSTNLPGNQQQLAWPEIKSPPRTSNVLCPTYQSGLCTNGRGSFEFLWLPLASSELLSPLLCSEAKNVQALKGD